MINLIQKPVFVGSFVREEQCPPDNLPEFAFIGRSNVGKSSLINMLCSTKGLAKVSNTPGKTQLMNYFRIDDTWFMVDLPGYGYAKVSQTQRAAWERMIWYFLKNRKPLACVFVLIDGMISPQKIDIEFLNKLGQHSIPFVMVYTKTDRITQRELSVNMDAMDKKLSETWEQLPEKFITSAEKGMGRKEILNFIQNFYGSN
jgi:GTP-binding protein